MLDDDSTESVSLLTPKHDKARSNTLDKPAAVEETAPCKAHLAAYFATNGPRQFPSPIRILDLRSEYNLRIILLLFKPAGRGKNMAMRQLHVPLIGTES